MTKPINLNATQPAARETAAALIARSQRLTAQVATVEAALRDVYAMSFALGTAASRG